MFIIQSLKAPGRMDTSLSFISSIGIKLVLLVLALLNFVSLIGVFLLIIIDVLSRLSLKLTTLDLSLTLNLSLYIMLPIKL